MIEGVRVVAEHMAVSHAHAAPVDGDDPACFERSKRGVCRPRTGLDAKVGSTRPERVDEGISTFFEIATGNGRPHRVGDDCGGEDFVQATDGGHDRTREVQGPRGERSDLYRWRSACQM